jgi:hypothetical protein
MKCNNIKFIKNGGWHFSNLKKAEEIELKLNSYLHHREFELSKVTLKQIKEAIIDKTAIYDLTKDQRNEKIGKGKKLIKIENKDLPNFIITNKEKFKYINSLVLCDILGAYNTGKSFLLKCAEFTCTKYIKHIWECKLLNLKSY